MSWKPVDIAPRDGTRIVIAYRSPVSQEVCISVSWWNEEDGWESDGEEAPELMEGLVPFAWVDFPDS